MTPPSAEDVRILVVDDHAPLRRTFQRILHRAGYAVTVEDDAPAAIEALGRGDYDVVLTDLNLPSGTGMEVLAAAQERDPNLPVLLLTGTANLDVAHRAVEQGVLRFLSKPLTAEQLLAAIGEALRVRAATRSERSGSVRLRALEADLSRVRRAVDFDLAVDRMWMALQPVVSTRQRRVIAYEALLRSDHPTFGRPDLLIAAAEELGRLFELGGRIRAAVAARLDEVPADVDILVNLHPGDLADPDLYDPGAPLSRCASRIILELTERASLDKIEDVHDRVSRLRELGYRIAIDDLGAGYGSLSAMALIRPDLVKIDMSLVRDVDADPVRLRMITSIGSMCDQLGTPWLCEGVETGAELAALVANGVDLAQGYLLGRPARTVTAPSSDFLGSLPSTRDPRRSSNGDGLPPLAQAICEEALAMVQSASAPVAFRAVLSTLHDVLSQMVESVAPSRCAS